MLLAIVASTTFISAWTLDYWQAWVFLRCIFWICLCDNRLFDKKRSTGFRGADYGRPGRREGEEPESNTIFCAVCISFGNFLLLLSTIIFGWSMMSCYINFFGDILIIVGFYIVFLVFKANTFASALVEVEPIKKLSRPDRMHSCVIRCTGALILLLGVPLSLGSWWGMLTVIPITLLIIWRLLDEERF